MAKKMIKNMVLDEITFCGAGMNPKADILIHKSMITKEQMEEGVKMFSDVLADMVLSEQMHEVMEILMSFNQAFRISVFEILHEDDISVEEKKKSLKETLNQYVAAVGSMASDSKMKKSFQAWLSENPDVDRDGLMKHLSTQHKEATQMDELQKAQDELKKAKKENEKLQAQVAKATRLATMTDGQKTFYNELPADKQDDFLAKSSDEMDLLVKKAVENDEVLIVGDSTIHKSKVDAGVFAVLKAQQQQIEKDRQKHQDDQEKLAKAEEARVNKAFQDQAETEYPNLPGSPEHKGTLLKAINGLDEEPKKTATELLKAANTAMGKSFDTSGHGAGGGDLSDAETKLNKMATDLAAKENITYHNAYDKVMKSEEGTKLYNQTLN